MSNGQHPNYVDPEDMFSDTRMSFGDHIEELRWHLWRAIYGFVIAMVASLFIGQYVLAFIKAPVEDQLSRFYERVSKDRARREMANTDTAKDKYARPVTFNIRFNRNEFRAMAGLPPLQEPVGGNVVLAFEEMLGQLDVAFLINRDLLKESHMGEMTVQINDPRFEQQIAENTIKYHRSHLSTLNVTEAFFVYFQVSMITGFILASPWIFYQIWAFIAAGLYQHEKRLVNVYLPVSLFLFLAGVAVCQFLVLPKAVEALLWFNEWLGLDPDLRLSEWLSFAIMMPVVFGISFQTPLVMLFMYRIGIVEIETFRNKRRMAWFLMAIFAAVITPSVDALSMLFLWVPMGFLYEMGILMCVWQPNQPFEDLEPSETEEMVEV